MQKGIETLDNILKRAYDSFGRLFSLQTLKLVYYESTFWMIIKLTGKDMTNTDLSDFMLQHHAVFKKEAATTYKCLKDRFHQISPGATISNQMLNCYLTLVPRAARVKIVECELYEGDKQ